MPASVPTAQIPETGNWRQIMMPRASETTPLKSGPAPAFDRSKSKRPNDLKDAVDGEIDRQNERERGKRHARSRNHVATDDDGEQTQQEDEQPVPKRAHLEREKEPRDAGDDEHPYRNCDRKPCDERRKQRQDARDDDEEPHHRPDTRMGS